MGHLYALDFDGVLCDSCGESAISAVKVNNSMCQPSRCCLCILGTWNKQLINQCRTSNRGNSKWLDWVSWFGGVTKLERALRLARFFIPSQNLVIDIWVPGEIGFVGNWQNWCVCSFLELGQVSTSRETPNTSCCELHIQFKWCCQCRISPPAIIALVIFSEAGLTCQRCFSSLMLSKYEKRYRQCRIFSSYCLGHIF